MTLVDFCEVNMNLQTIFPQNSQFPKKLILKMITNFQVWKCFVLLQ